MRRLRTGWAALAVAALIADGGIAAAPAKKTPYFASLAPSRARMRSGPGRTYPTIWLYVRPDLPVKVIGTFKEWRKIEDPGGTQGWVLGNLVSTTRTALIHGAVAELRERPAVAGKVLWRAEPNVVGRLSQCGNGWCRFDVRGQAGFVETRRLWGVAPDETLP